MSIIRKSSNKSLISDTSARLQKLEVERAIGTGTGASNCDNYDPELAEIQARYAKYKEEKAEKWRRLGREPTYHESCAELTFSQYLYCVKGLRSGFL